MKYNAASAKLLDRGHFIFCKRAFAVKNHGRRFGFVLLYLPDKFRSGHVGQSKIDDNFIDTLALQRGQNFGGGAAVENCKVFTGKQLLH